ncbi:MAG: hypothetical protein JWQ96_2661 [Segetibacter sp.]|nr:hypothetical protein [Segetibacter sp.]
MSTVPNTSENNSESSQNLGGAENNSFTASQLAEEKIEQEAAPSGHADASKMDDKGIKKMNDEEGDTDE